MPVVPISRSPKGTTRPMPDEPWALMGAAQMHAEGRLIQAMSTEGFRKSPDVDDRRDDPKPQSNEPSADKPPRGRPNTPLAEDLGAQKLVDK